MEGVCAYAARAWHPDNLPTLPVDGPRTFRTLRTLSVSRRRCLTASMHCKAHAAAAAAQCALQCMLAGTQRRRLTEWVLSVPNVRGPSTGRVGRLSACQARAALAHTPSIFRWSFFFYYSPVFLPQFPHVHVPSTLRGTVASTTCTVPS